ncbi:hypothetical protein HMPREF2532_02382 [Bacteroides ovatus]|nr:hypothetical protein HMPREF2532_02382 [Bacteroides ovatus]
MKLYFYRDGTFFSLRWNFFFIVMKLLFNSYEIFSQVSFPSQSVAYQS